MTQSAPQPDAFPAATASDMPAAADSASPLVRNLVYGLANQIRSGQLRPGQRLASIRQLAAQHAISFRTALNALQQLEQMGLVESRQGSGTYVRSAASSWLENRPAPARQATAVYLVMLHRPEAFQRLMQPLVPLLHEHNLMPVPVDLPQNRSPEEVFETLRRHWEYQPPRAVVIRGGRPRLHHLVRRHAPPSARLVLWHGALVRSVRGFHTVGPDEIASYRLASEYLLARGHRRLGLLAMPRPRLPEDKRLGIHRQIHIQTLLETLAEHGLSRANLTAHFNRQSAVDLDGQGENAANVDRVARWLTGPQAPTGIIGTTFRLGCVQLAANLVGRRIGRDIDLVGIGDIGPAQRGLFACVDEQYDLVARHVLKLILSDEPDSQHSFYTVTVEPRLVTPGQAAAPLDRSFVPDN